MEIYQDTGLKGQATYYDDSKLAQDLDPITVVRVWHKDFVEGIEIWYGPRSSGQHIGMQRNADTNVDELMLGIGEYITEIRGRSGHWLDSITFITNEERKLECGKSLGGGPFRLFAPGMVIKCFRYEVGNYVNYIGAVFGPSNHIVGSAPGIMTLPAPIPGGMPGRMPGGMPGGMHVGMNVGMPGGMSMGMSSGMTGQMGGSMSTGMGGPVSVSISGPTHGGMPGGMPGGISVGMHGGMPGGMTGGMPGGVSIGMQGRMPGGMSGQMPGGMSGGMGGQMPGGMSGPMPGRMGGNISVSISGPGMSGGMMGADAGPQPVPMPVPTYPYKPEPTPQYPQEPQGGMGGMRGGMMGFRGRGHFGGHGRFQGQGYGPQPGYTAPQMYGGPGNVSGPGYGTGGYGPAPGYGPGAGFGPMPGQPGGGFGPQPMQPLKSDVVGKTHENDRFFDDYTEIIAPLMEQGCTSAIDDVTILSNGKLVIGIECIYRITRTDGTVEFKKATHTGSEKGIFTNKKKLKLNPGDSISMVRGRCGDLIDRIDLITVAGSAASSGGTGGSEFDLAIPSGRKVIAFGGSLCGFMSTFYVYHA